VIGVRCKHRELISIPIAVVSGNAQTFMWRERLDDWRGMWGSALEREAYQLEGDVAGVDPCYLLPCPWCNALMIN
jgi:hypothetical protein